MLCNWAFTHLYHRLQVLQRPALPPTGPAILVCNHTSPMDPLFIQSMCTRPIVWMMAREYYEMPGLHWIYKQIEAIPVARSGRDMAATRDALRALKNGRVLGIFPEGKIELTDELLPFQAGIALLASKSGAEIFPCYLDGSQRCKSMIRSVLLPQRARMLFGEGLGKALSERGNGSAQDATTAVQVAVQNLLEQSRGETVRAIMQK
jgi:1-acyl-sn-glycerol-3-phosphate acyltransferase